MVVNVYKHMAKVMIKIYLKTLCRLTVTNHVTRTWANYPPVANFL